MTASTHPGSAPAGSLPGLAVVLPCFDEAPNVAAAVAAALRAGERCARAVEVIVVDDGCRDGTRAVAEWLAAADARVRVVVHDANRGYGAAVRSGIAATRQPWVLLTDADLQFDLSELEAFLPLAGSCDLIAGHRIDRADPLGRRLAAHAWNRLMRRSFGVCVHDVDCAFKLVRRDALRALELTSTGAMISTELLVRGGMAHWRVAEIGVHHRPRAAGDPTGGDPRVMVHAFRERRALLRLLAAETPAPARPRRTRRQRARIAAH